MRWSDLIEPTITKKAYELADRAAQETALGNTTYPPRDAIFRALRLTTPDNLKICVVGQDPYHTPGQADGLAFSTPDGHPIQPSLRNIYKELRDDLGIESPENGNLEKWAAEGVLLLNTSLSVYESRPGSCIDWGWDEFTHAVFAAALELQKPVVFLLWGAKAINFLADVDFASHPDKLAICSSHPSPFSADRGTRRSPAFLGSRPFSRANTFLVEHGVAPVNWSLA